MEYVKACNGVKIKKWTDLSNTMNGDSITKLKSIYANVNDIDLIVGGIFEKIDKDASIGPTFNCILSELVFFKNCEYFNNFDNQQFTR